MASGSCFNRLMVSAARPSTSHFICRDLYLSSRQTRFKPQLTFASRSLTSPSRNASRYPQIKLEFFSSRRSSTSSQRPHSPSSASEAYRAALARRNLTRNRSIAYWTMSILILTFGVSYAAVPLYRAFCSSTGFGGTPMTDSSRFTADKLFPRDGEERRIVVRFNADSSKTLPWKFLPQQKEVWVKPGETALAFYKAWNKSDKDIIGVATYNVQPEKVAPYFAKVECFCFEEQRLLAGEEVDLPVFFFIDRDILDDPHMRDVHDVILSYTFFKAKRDDFGNLIPDDGTGKGKPIEIKDHGRPTLPT